MANNISPLASVSPEAKIGQNVVIDPFVVVEPDVVIGDGCRVRAHSSILNGTRMGRDNTIHEGCVISASPQDFRWKGEDSLTVIGDGNVIRENVIINRSIHPGGETRIGNENFIMAQVHIGHDTTMTNHCVIGNGVKIAGNVRMSHCTILSSGAIVHEDVKIGPWVLVKGGCRVTSNIPPYVIMAHNPISYFGVNAYLMRRGRKSEETIDDIAKCYRLIYQSNTSVFNAVRRITEDVAQSRERDAVLSFLDEVGNKIAGANSNND